MCFLFLVSLGVNSKKREIAGLPQFKKMCFFASCFAWCKLEEAWNRGFTPILKKCTLYPLTSTCYQRSAKLRENFRSNSKKCVFSFQVNSASNQRINRGLTSGPTLKKIFFSLSFMLRVVLRSVKSRVEPNFKKMCFFFLDLVHLMLKRSNRGCAPSPI
jgi:hypothetical protein